MLEKKYKVRAAGTTKKVEHGKELKLHPDWCRYNGIETGDVMKVLASSVMVLLPPGTSEQKEAKVRAFLERSI